MSVGGERRRHGRHGGIAAAFAVALAALAASGAGAQGPVVIGGSGQPSVEIDLDAIQSYGVAPRGERRLLVPGQDRPPGAAIVLRPPKGMTAAEPGAAVTLRPPESGARTGAPPPPAQRAAPTGPAPKPMPKAAPAPAAPTPRTGEGALATAPLPPPPVAVPAPTAPPPAAPKPSPPAAAPAPSPPPPAMRPAPSEQPQRMAALPPGAMTEIEGSQGLRILFEGSSSGLTTAAETQLKALAESLAGGDSRVQLKAYAGGSSETVSMARRLSLSRALAVRSFLIEQGIRSTRIDVRALGVAQDDGPGERVDVLLQGR